MACERRAIVGQRRWLTVHGMRRTVPIVIAILTVLPAAAQMLDRHPAAEQPMEADSPVIVAVGADSEEIERLDNAVALFDDSGLRLPDLEVHFLDDMAACRDHYGLFQEGYTPWRVLICSGVPFVLPHELGHAWVAANLTDLDRDQYRQARGFTNWNDRNSPWNERATEDAAFILQQNLTAQYASKSSAMWRERAEAFELLTGQISPVRALDTWET